MHRIDAPNAVPNMFGEGKPGFTDKNIQTGVKGTLVDDDWLNAVQENLCRVVEAAGIVLAKGQHEQLLQAIKVLAWGNTQSRPIGYYETVPKVKAEPLVYVEPFGLMRWVDAVGLYRSTDCGAVLLHPSATPRTGTIKASGATLSKTIYAGLWSWVQENGLVVASASWAAGTTQYADLGGDSFRIPDLRGEFFRAWDDGRGVDTGRQPGSWQKGTATTADTVFNDGTSRNLQTVNVKVGTSTNTDYSNVAADIGADQTVSADYNRCGITSASGDSSTSNLPIGTVYTTRPRNVALTVCIKY